MRTDLREQVVLVCSMGEVGERMYRSVRTDQESGRTDELHHAVDYQFGPRHWGNMCSQGRRIQEGPLSVEAPMRGSKTL